MEQAFFPSLQVLAANAVRKSVEKNNEQPIAGHLLELITNAPSIFRLQTTSKRIKKLIVEIDETANNLFDFSLEDFNNRGLMTTAFIIKVAVLTGSFYSLCTTKLDFTPSLHTMVIAAAVMGVITWKTSGRIVNLNQAILDCAILIAIFKLGRFCHDHGIDVLAISSASERKFKRNIASIKQQIELTITNYQQDLKAALPHQTELQDCLQRFSHHQYKDKMLTELRQLDQLVDGILRQLAPQYALEITAEPLAHNRT